MDTKEGQQLMMNNQKAMQLPPPPRLNPTPAPAISSGDVYKGTSNKNMLRLGGYDTARRSSATDEKTFLTRIDAAEVLSRKLPSQLFQMNSFEKLVDNGKCQCNNKRLPLSSWDPTRRSLAPALFLFNSGHQQQDEEQNSIQPMVSRNSMFRRPINMELQMMQLQWENSMHRRYAARIFHISNLTPTFYRCPPFAFHELLTWM
jgi:hypothetical protein